MSDKLDESMISFLHTWTKRRGYQLQHAQAEALLDTPARWQGAIVEMTQGYAVNVGELLSTQFEGVPSDDMVVLRGVSFVSLCEHHLFPFTGVATVAYIPTDNRVVGLSKLARLVDAHAQRLQVQERMTHDIAEDLMTHLEPKGAAAVVQGRHGCMSCRGVRKDAEMVTSSMRGLFRDDPKARAELLALAAAAS